MNILIIPDGNRRWAKENGLSFDDAYKRCAEKLAESFEWLKTQGISEVWVLVCSTNNLKRPADQVNSYLKHFLDVQDYTDTPLSFTVSGAELLDQTYRKAYEDLTKTEPKPGSFTVHYLIGWSLDNEMVRLVNHFRDNARSVDRGEIVEASDIKEEIDLIIRTGKVSRISEVVPWHSPYAEICFVNVYWPDVTVSDLQDSIAFCENQERRSGL